jgi:hypothetical protein
MADRLTRISLGFQGGQVLALRIPTDKVDELRQMLQSSQRWHTLAAEDGDAVVDLEQVVYLRVESSDQHVGF